MHDDLYDDDDLNGAFQPPPPGRAQPMFYRQGKIEEWDPVTGRNVVNCDGALIRDIPIQNTTEALLLQPGDVVGIQVVGSTWAIQGRYVIPGTPEASSALSSIRAASDKIVTSQSTGSTSYTDLATIGPRVVVTVGPSGRLLIIISATIAKSGTAFYGAMSVQLTGANTVAPDSTESLSMDDLAIPGFSRAILMTGLTPGQTTITAKYIADANLVFFSGRTLIAIAL